MVKIIGLFLGVIGCGAIGLLKARDIKDRKQLLLEFKSLLLHISTEISYFKEPLPQIFERLSAENEGACGLLLRNCLTSYLTSGRDMGELWKDSVDFVYESLPVTEQDVVLMKKCADFLGQSDFKRQQEHFLLLHRQLDEQIEEAQRWIDSKGKMYERLGFSAGLVIAIALI
ncbi:MAG: hypothetical protein HFE71_03260 [Emergencia sp.]|jgi:stage III sporulation protein AB|uniref:Stage III sporulation protein SpoAB n=1 Tax=Anaerotruncus colihominis TaxID=169435 RepID=A0A845QKB9_9FIRM|nr:MULTISPECIES: stage III sporulation protein AB [Clostridia]MCI9475487.1 hypothetical protein [Emergencia sp.]MCI9639601.1 hypothetical protein [Emergencia sp.]NBH61137.1 hypothetical protein [Anaerotruncus colihominis]NCE98947.1 hypothetical protein [Emergencia sp. 1XD21-10]NCF01792.1 hypothetical protein [Anaerotruncus sp. 80]